MSYAILKNGNGWRSVSGPEDVTDEETYSETQPVPPPPTPEQVVISKIVALEAEITPRRQREAILGVDAGWLESQDASIAELAKNYPSENSSKESAMKKFITGIAALILSASAFAIDLRDYFPASNTVTLRMPDGTANARYTFTASPPGLLALYNTFLTLNKPGYHYSWRKEYWKNNAWCTATYAVLFMGDDLSVTEVGDWYASTPCTPNTVFGYKTAQSGGVNTGLVWSPPGGLTTAPAIREMFTASQAAPGAAYLTSSNKAYSKTGLIEVLPTYTPPYGRDTSGAWCAGCAKTYTDVVHIVMYHGTRTSAPVQIRCGTTSPIAANGAYYQSFKDYNSYGIELYIAKDIGIIEERTPFIEDASYWGGAFPNCSGSLFGGGFVKFIDD